MIEHRARDKGPPGDAIRSGLQAGEPWALLQSSVLFAALTITECREIAELSRHRTFNEHQIIFAAGEPIREVLLIKAGTVKVAQFSTNAHEVILGVYGPGEVLGALGAAAGSHHTWSAHALEPGSALSWSVEAFDGALDRYAGMRRNIMRILSDRLHEIEQRFHELATKRVADRVARELVRVLGHIGKPVKGAMEINLSREELAQLTGTTLFTISRLLSEWQQQGIVTARRGGVAVHDSDQLLNLGDSDPPRS
jgi:CRP-like cAMP-binding protein